MLNSEKIGNLRNMIINYINNAEIFDENYIFNLSKNYVKKHNIEITKGEIKSIINNIIQELKNCEKIKNLDNELYYKNKFEFEKNPIKNLLNSIDTDYII